MALHPSGRDPGIDFPHPDPVVHIREVAELRRGRADLPLELDVLHDQEVGTDEAEERQAEEAEAAGGGETSEGRYAEPRKGQREGHRVGRSGGVGRSFGGGLCVGDAPPGG